MFQFVREDVIRRLIKRIKKFYPEAPTVYSENDLARLRIIKDVVNSMWENHEKSRKVIRMDDYRRKEIKNG